MMSTRRTDESDASSSPREQLLSAASDLIRHLVGDFESVIDVAEGVDSTTFDLRVGSTVQISRQGGPSNSIVFEVTDEEEVAIRLGRWHIFYFPQSEPFVESEVRPVLATMQGIVDAYANGRFVEELRDGQLYRSWTSSYSESEGSTSVPQHFQEDSDQRISWPAWTQVVQ